MSDSRSASRPDVRWLTTTTSTQDAARALLADGARPPLLVATDDQTGGRGRLGRAWITPPGAGLAVTLACEVTTPSAQRTWFPLVAGLGVIDALNEQLGIRSLAGPEAADSDAGIGLKWPNDVHDARGRKLAGILVEADGAGRLLIGIGINLAPQVRDRDGRPVPSAVSLAELTSHTPPPARTLAEVVGGGVAAQVAHLDRCGGDAVFSGQADRYRETCVTSGRQVHVTGRSGRPDVAGRCLGIDAQGRLLLRDPDGRRHRIDVGDVQHVRPAGGPGEAGSGAQRIRPAEGTR